MESDAGKIRQVLRNLLSNAIKFTPEGGSVDVSIKKVGIVGDDIATVEFSVKDSGIGIKQEDKDRVLMPLPKWIVAPFDSMVEQVWGLQSLPI